MTDPIRIPADLDRRHFLGGSDVADLIGKGYRTRLECWEEKTALEPVDRSLSPERQKFFRRRKEQEPFVARLLVEEYGISVTRLSFDEVNRYRDAEHEWMRCEVDFEFPMTPMVRESVPGLAMIADGTMLNGEIKALNQASAREWGEPGSDEAPVKFVAQALYGCAITGRPACLIVPLFGLDDLKVYPVIADATAIETLRSLAVNFWHNHVLTREPPPPQSLEDLERMYGGISGRVCELSPHGETILNRIFAIRESARTAEKDRHRLEAELALEIFRAWGSPDGHEGPVDNALLIFAGQAIATWREQGRTSIDTERLRADYPRIARELTRETRYRVLRPVKAKK